MNKSPSEKFKKVAVHHLIRKLTNHLLNKSQDELI